jgi:prepilin-type N-terminal cleavage/methylation domain-containing protein
MARSGSRQRSEAGFSLVELLVVVAIVGIVGGMAVPRIDQALASTRMRNDSKEINKLVGLAKLRATAQFSRARLAANVAARQYRLEVWNKVTGRWVTEGAVRTLSRDVSFGFGAVTTPPPDTQAAIGQSGECTTSTSLTTLDSGTACITFNSRGIPILPSGDPVGGNAIYVTDTVGVRGITVTGTPLIREWWSAAHTAGWIRQ